MTTSSIIGALRIQMNAMRGRKCWGGIDLSSKIDLAAFALVFPPSEDRKRWRYIVRCFTPEDTLLERERRDRVPYHQLVAEGWLTTNPGNRLDQDVIREAVKDARDVFELDIQQLGFDPWNAGNLEKDLQDDGFQVIEIPQTMAHMSAPAKEYEADVLDGLVDTGGNPLMARMASNVVVNRDGKDNIYPVKKKSRGRIDGIIASLIARKVSTLEQGEGDSVYEKRGLATV
jgi:phage terminase large subunit-like protein